MAWVGFQVGMTDPHIGAAKRELRRKFSYAKLLDTSDYFTESLRAVLIEYQQRKNVELLRRGEKLLRTDGVLDWATQVALGSVVVTPPNQDFEQGYDIVHFSINGAGSTWDTGYAFDIGQALDKRKCYHQPIGYNTNPFPMRIGIADGEEEFVRQLFVRRGPLQEDCTQIPWCATVYSMGAIVFMRVLMRVLYGDLQQFKATYMGSNAFGNPMREKGHTLPGGIDPGGEGIVTPTAHGTPVEHWDFAAGKNMPGSPGIDLYSCVGAAGENADAIADERAVWDIVNTANPLNLGERVLDLAASPTFHEGVGAIQATFTALDFFVVKGLTPHTSYQFIRPIAGDPRDCWRIALDHMSDIVARVPVRR